MNQFNKRILQSGMSLLEILIVVSIFAVLGIITTRSVLLTIQGSKKSESIIQVKENVDYATGVMERLLRNADSVTQCPNSDTSTLSYLDQDGNPATFSCVGIGSDDAYVASGSARLTNSNVDITACSLLCSVGVSANPPSITISIEAEDKNAVGSGASKVSTSTQVYLRSY